MGKVIPFRGREERKGTFEDDFTKILKDVAEIKSEQLGREENGIFCLNVTFEHMLKAKIGSFIIKNRLMNADLFRCGLYVAEVLGETLSKEYESYYVTDYYIRGIEDDNPVVLRQGADLCSVLCILFEERQSWRMMKRGDYVKMGIQLYSLYYAKTKRVIGWCMSRNFESIIGITRKCVKDMEWDGHRRAI
ncbi:MAG TPA: hypothetical protein DCP92_15615 [Nitrospiraceae bacterium]|jgi:hypothetical protein|nr:hypothetical protein [Nitrospiraceae bacterium]